MQCFLVLNGHWTGGLSNRGLIGRVAVDSESPSVCIVLGLRQVVTCTRVLSGYLGVTDSVRIELGAVSPDWAPLRMSVKCGRKSPPVHGDRPSLLCRLCRYKKDAPSTGPLVTVYEVYGALTGSCHALWIRSVEHANPSAGSESHRKSPSPSKWPYSVIRPSISHWSSLISGYYRDM